MYDLRLPAIGAVLGLGLSTVTLAQPAVDQRPPGPADPTSPGALVVPEAAKKEMDKMRRTEKRDTTRERGDGRGDPRSGTRDGACSGAKPCQGGDK
jgi:hypothetical protein